MKYDINKPRPDRKRNFTKKQWDIVGLLWQNLTPEQILKQCPEYNIGQINRVLYWMYDEKGNRR